jgi:hypothetical protein
MLGTIVYALLDVSLNATIWISQVTVSGIYYLLGYPIEDTEPVSNQTILDKIKEQSEIITQLNIEMIELKHLHSNKKE